MKEEEGSSCSGSQQMSSSVDDAISDIKQQTLLVPEVIVSCSVFVSFVFTVAKSMIKSESYHILDTQV
jgi:hypothetical protein